MSDARAPGTLSFDVWLAFLYGLVIFIVGSLPSTPPVAREVSDKLQHCVGFAVLAWLWCRALRRLRPQLAPARVALGGFLVSVLLGGGLELWQALLSYRSCELLDWVADAAGAVLGVLVYEGLRLVSRPRVSG